MLPHVSVYFGVCDFVEVFTRSGHEFSESLTNILESTSSAVNGIDQI